MGFSAERYPSLPATVREYIGSRKELVPEAEDSMVGEILEELLLLSPQKPPVASGSGTRQAAAKPSLASTLFG